MKKARFLFILNILLVALELTGLVFLSIFMFNHLKDNPNYSIAQKYVISFIFTLIGVIRLVISVVSMILCKKKDAMKIMRFISIGFLLLISAIIATYCIEENKDNLFKKSFIIIGIEFCVIECLLSIWFLEWYIDRSKHSLGLGIMVLFIFVIIIAGLPLIISLVRLVAQVTQLIDTDGKFGRIMKDVCYYSFCVFTIIALKKQQTKLKVVEQ